LPSRSPEAQNASVRRALLVVLALALLAPAGAAAAPPPIKHVWIVTLENKDFADTFGADTEAPYLARELTKSGQLLTNYYGTSHLSLGNYLTMVSGQAANPLTQADCLQYVDIFPGIAIPDGQILGVGCVFPPSVKTIANQLEEKGLSWRGYMEDMGTPCRHPAIGAIDDTQDATATGQYATRHNPFVYFHSIIDSPTCAKNVVPLGQLLDDIKSLATTPNYAFITPDLCNDGHDPTCADGGLGGLPAVDQFLRKWVPAILGSPGFADSGMLIVTWDEANVDVDSSTACCGEPIGPNTPLPGILGLGGGRTGSVVISPFVRPGSMNDTAYNHYGLLRSIEDIFGLGHLGYAGAAGLRAFGDDVYNRPGGAPPRTPGMGCRANHSGQPVAALRLRARVLTFRARRSEHVHITARLRSGRVVVVRRRLALRGCRTYSLHAPAGVTSVTVRAGTRVQRVRRGPSGEHD
jgi:hypothetical protein